MITSFLKSEQDVHRRVQTWRSENPLGYIINVRSARNAMIHRTMCIAHLGDTEWQEGRPNWGSLGNTTKICCSSKDELTNWAKAELSAPLKICKHCNP